MNFPMLTKKKEKKRRWVLLRLHGCLFVDVSGLDMHDLDGVGHLLNLIVQVLCMVLDEGKTLFVLVEDANAIGMPWDKLVNDLLSIVGHVVVLADYFLQVHAQCGYFCL